MPKEKESHGELILRIAEKYPKIFRVDNSILYCIVCEQKVTAQKMFQAKQHIDTKGHKKNEAKKNTECLPMQSLLSDYVGSSKGPQLKEFSMELCKMLVDTNIPIHKIIHPSFIEFMQKYTKKEIPSDSNIRTNYLPILYDLTMRKLREKADGRKIWVSVDETTDVEMRMVANFVFGILDDEAERGKSYLLNMAELDQTNANTIAVFFNESLSLLWPKGMFARFAFVLLAFLFVFLSHSYI